MVAPYSGQGCNHADGLWSIQLARTIFSTFIGWTLIVVNSESAGHHAERIYPQPSWPCSTGKSSSHSDEDLSAGMVSAAPFAPTSTYINLPLASASARRTIEW